MRWDNSMTLETYIKYTASIMGFLFINTFMTPRYLCLQEAVRVKIQSSILRRQFSYFRSSRIWPNVLGAFLCLAAPVMSKNNAVGAIILVCVMFYTYVIDATQIDKIIKNGNY